MIVINLPETLLVLIDGPHCPVIVLKLLGGLPAAPSPDLGEVAGGGHAGCVDTRSV